MFLQTIQNHGIKLTGAIVAIAIVAFLEITQSDMSGENIAILWLAINGVVGSIQSAIKRSQKGDFNE